MKKMHKVAAFAALPIIGLSLVGAGTASAHGFGGNGFGFGGMMKQTLSAEDIATHQNSMFEQQADLLGISIEDVKTAWAEGTSFRDLALAHGITDEQLKEKMKTVADARIKAELQALVDKGVITQAQADKRLATITTKMTNMSEKKMMKHTRGFGKKIQEKAGTTNQ